VSDFESSNSPGRSLQERTYENQHEKCEQTCHSHYLHVCPCHMVAGRLITTHVQFSRFSHTFTLHDYNTNNIYRTAMSRTANTRFSWWWQGGTRVQLTAGASRSPAPKASIPSGIGRPSLMCKQTLRPSLRWRKICRELSPLRSEHVDIAWLNFILWERVCEREWDNDTREEW